LPVPESTKAKNGLNYQSNPKHTKGQLGNRPNAGIEPRNSLELFEDSIAINSSANKGRYTMDSQGYIHQFLPDNTGNWHWAGSTADKKNPLRLDNSTKASLRKQEGWKLK
jgi:hypothetical protein